MSPEEMSDVIYGPAGTRIAIPPLVKPEPSMAGMSLRDYFAGQVLAVLARQLYDHEKDEAARRAYEYADAMLAARDAKEGEK